MTTNTADTEWWRAFFASPDWFAIHTTYSDDRTPVEADLIARLLQVEPGARLLDVPCGQGRHALEFAARGYHVTGVDITAALLDQARRDAAESSLEVEWVQADMRELNYNAQFDGAYCFFGSFGYFDDAGNRAFLESAARALVPGGALLIDTHCLESLLPKLQPRGWTRLGDMIRMEERHYDHETGRINVEWITFRDGHIFGTHHSSIALYAYHEIAAMLRDAGFATVEGYDTATGKPFAVGAARLCIVARRANDEGKA